MSRKHNCRNIIKSLKSESDNLKEGLEILYKNYLELVIENENNIDIATKALTNISKDRMGKDKRYMVEVAKKALEEMNQ